jgi:hypothetical protein
VRSLGTVNVQAARAIELARRSRPPMKCFVRDLGRLLDRPTLARQTVYEWESGRAQVPAAALIAAAEVARWTVDDLLRLAGSERGRLLLIDHPREGGRPARRAGGRPGEDRRT